MRVFVVDDELPCLDDIVYMLSRHGDIEVAGAFTRPAEALAAAEVLRPDALFLDLAMPGMSGVALAKRVHAFLPGVRIVIVTAYARELDAAGNLPVFAGLLKPVRGDKLAEVLDRLRADLSL